MARLALLLFLLAQPGSGPGSAMWTVTFETFADVDPGNGVLLGTEGTRLTVNSSEVRRSRASTHRGKASRPDERTWPLPAPKREAIAALLASLPPEGRYSISPSVNDEGSYGEELTVERGGRTLHYHLEQGRQAPPMPEALARLQALLAGLSSSP